MKQITYDPAQFSEIKIIRHKSWLRPVAYVLFFIAGILAGLAIAGVMV